MKYIFLFILFSACIKVNAQKSINLDEVGKYIGDSVKVCGHVYDTYYAVRTENTPTFLNMGAKYPDQKLTVVIWGDVRKTFEFKPEEFYKDIQICIVGRITEYQGKPQIVITSREQLKMEK